MLVVHQSHLRVIRAVPFLTLKPRGWHGGFITIYCASYGVRQGVFVVTSKILNNDVYQHSVKEDMLPMERGMTDPVLKMWKRSSVGY